MNNDKTWFWIAWGIQLFFLYAIPLPVWLFTGLMLFVWFVVPKFFAHDEPAPGHPSDTNLKPSIKN